MPVALDRMALDLAVEHLAAADPDLAGIVARHGHPPLWDREPGFPTLLHIVLEQQVSLASAAAAYARVRARAGAMTPTALLATTPEQLREDGVSRQKDRYLRALATAVETGDLDLDALENLPDDEVAARLTALPGIGRWTAEMFLIFHLMRPNVLPLDDIGLLNGISRNYFSGDPVSRSDAREVAMAWSPFCSVGTWYIWRSLDPLPVEY